MNTIREAVHEYLALRRSLGFKLVDMEYWLLQFAAFLEERKVAYITQELALAWAQQPANVQPYKWAQRLTSVRGFARYRKAADPRTEVPEPGLLPYRCTRPRPYLYSDEETRALMRAARNMPYYGERQALLPWTYYCLIGLLSVSGLRLGEARDLVLQDVDLESALLTVPAGKFGRTRLVPLHDSTCRVLADYIGRRQRHWQDRPIPNNLFLSSRGAPLDPSNVHRFYRNLTRKIGLREPDKRRGPRLHDFRHTLAVRTLENWYRQDQDPDRMLPILSTFLGHVGVSDTYWYLENSPGLMKEAMRRLESRWEGHS